MTKEVPGPPSHSAGVIVPDLNPNTQAPVSRVTPEGLSLQATGNNGPWEKHTPFGKRRPSSSAPDFCRQSHQGNANQKDLWVFSAYLPPQIQSCRNSSRSGSSLRLSLLPPSVFSDRTRASVVPGKCLTKHQLWTSHYPLPLWPTLGADSRPSYFFSRKLRVIFYLHK